MPFDIKFTHGPGKKNTSPEKNTHLYMTQILCLAIPQHRSLPIHPHSTSFTRWMVMIHKILSFNKSFLPPILSQAVTFPFALAKFQGNRNGTSNRTDGHTKGNAGESHMQGDRQEVTREGYDNEI